MTRIEVKSRVGSDGVLTLRVPIGMAEANREVVVTVQPSEGMGVPAVDQREWRQFVEETAGGWQGEPLARPEQGELENRDDWVSTISMPSEVRP